jgi:hypothetical protein
MCGLRLRAISGESRTAWVGWAVKWYFLFNCSGSLCASCLIGVHLVTRLMLVPRVDVIKGSVRSRFGHLLLRVQSLQNMRRA